MHITDSSPDGRWHYPAREEECCAKCLKLSNRVTKQTEKTRKWQSTCCTLLSCHSHCSEGERIASSIISVAVANWKKYFWWNSHNIRWNNAKIAHPWHSANRAENPLKFAETARFNGFGDGERWTLIDNLSIDLERWPTKSVINNLRASASLSCWSTCFEQHKIKAN